MKSKFSLLLLLMLFIGILSFSGSAVAMDESNASSSGIGGIVVLQDNSTDAEDEEEIGDDDEDGVDNEKEAAYERQIESEYGDTAFKIQSTLKNDTNKDKFEIEFSIGETDTPVIQMKFENSAGSNETSLQYKIIFGEIIEFIDEGVPGYENETVLTQYEIGKVGWSPLTVVENVTSGLIIINATTSDGVFSLIMRMASNFLVDENVTLSPNSLKIDVLINNFDYNTTGSKLAVKGHLKTSSEMKIDDESEDELEGIASDETEVSISSPAASGFFSWSDFADVDGQKVAVIASNLSDSSAEEGEPSNKMYYTINATDAVSVLWDPKVGVVSAAAKAGYAEAIVPDTTSDAVSTPVDVVTTPVEEATDANPLPGFEIWVFFGLAGIALFSRRRMKISI